MPFSVIVGHEPRSCMASCSTTPITCTTNSSLHFSPQPIVAGKAGLAECRPKAAHQGAPAKCHEKKPRADCPLHPIRGSVIPKQAPGLPHPADAAPSPGFNDGRMAFRLPGHTRLDPDAEDGSMLQRNVPSSHMIPTVAGMDMAASIPSSMESSTSLRFPQCA